jgi:hypothetical protein
MRLNVPANTKPDTYTGKIQVVGVGQWKLFFFFFYYL